MIDTRTRGKGALSLMVALTFAPLCGAAASQTAKFVPPRTRDGRPDLHGVWAANFATTLQRPDGVVGLVVLPDKAKKLITDYNTPDEKVYDPDIDAPINKATELLEINGELRSSLIVVPSDGKLPLTALGRVVQARAKELRKTAFDNPEERPDYERCVGGAGDPPLVVLGDTIPSEIVQTPGDILIGTEDTHGARIVHMTGPAPPDALRSRAGHSVGRWDGDVLVIETDHFAVDDPSGVQFRDAAMISRASRVLERLELVSADRLLYRFTIEDPALYEHPWSLVRGAGVSPPGRTGARIRLP